MEVYLDNAATTPLDPAVIAVMTEVMTENFGNPSSIHAGGRRTRTIIERARRTVAGFLNASPAEIFFTSGGTEADNMAIRQGVHDHGIKHIITSPLEHHAVLHTIEELEKQGDIKISYLPVDAKGHIDYEQLENLLQNHPRTFVSLMHGNNEIGTMTDIVRVGELCEKYHAVFHSDTVQTMGHFPIDTKACKTHFVTGSAHKFHGPKGIGFIYINQDFKIKPLIYGGAQERNMRGGTENLIGIVGLEKALELSVENMEEHQAHILGLKQYMIKQLIQTVPDVQFNGDLDPEHSLYTVLNVSFPFVDLADMLLFNLDIMGICASGGSACSSGSDIGSHVLAGIGAVSERPCVRFSFSKYNTREDIDFVVAKLEELKQHA